MIKELTSLRGIFILFIFFHHCLNIYPGGGSMAVAFFFVLGGFSMTLGYKDRVLRPDFSYRQYITKRLIKFYPLHWICLLAVLPLILVIGWKQFVVLGINAALMQTLIPVQFLYFSYNSVSWYLANTLIFAVVFPSLLQLILKASPRRKVIIAISVALVYMIAAILLPNELYHPILYISPYARITDFIFGICLALGYFKLTEMNIEGQLPQNKFLWQAVIVSLIVLLVVESCLLDKTAIHVAPVYWVFIGILILATSLLHRIGGDYLKSEKYPCENSEFGKDLGGDTGNLTLAKTFKTVWGGV